MLPGLVLACIAVCLTPTAAAQESSAAVFSSKVICKQEGRYIGWPTIARTRSGELIVVFSGDRDAHVCPWGKTQMVRSADGGETWSEPVTINNTPLDDRDAGIIETRRGTLLVSWFTSLAFENPSQVNWQKLPEEVVIGWRRHAEKLGPETRAQWYGHWIRRSEDGGKTWGPPIRTEGSAPHGPIELADGRLLYVGRAMRDGTRALTAEESLDDGLTWQVIGTVPVPADENIDRYYEPHAVETASGKLVALFRYQPGDNDNDIMRQSESLDGGRTWSETRPTGIWGYPPHLLRLADGRLLVSYGRRRAPYSERGCISRDEGATWDTANEITIAPAPNADLGYPASVQLDDGSIVTVYYQVDQPGEKTCLMATHWRLDTGE